MGSRRNTSVSISSGSTAPSPNGTNFLLLLLGVMSSVISSGSLGGADLVLLLSRIMLPSKLRTNQVDLELDLHPCWRKLGLVAAAWGISPSSTYLSLSLSFFYSSSTNLFLGPCSDPHRTVQRGPRCVRFRSFFFFLYFGSLISLSRGPAARPAKPTAASPSRPRHEPLPHRSRRISSLLSLPLEAQAP